MGNQHTEQRREIKINKVVLDDKIRKNKRKKIKNMWKSLIYLNEKEKQFWGVIPGQKWP